MEQNETPAERHTALYDLPLEIFDMSIQKSYLQWVLNSKIKHRDEDVIRSLMSVDVCFNQRITRKRFKREIWRFWKDFCGKTRKRSAIIRNNRKYLLENIQPNDELYASLLSHNCLTQEQSHFIQRQRSNQDKNAELLYVAESFDEAKFSTFAKCLRQNNQKTVTRIIENGGGVTKLELQSRGANHTASMETQLLHHKIEDLRSKTKPRSHQTEKIISQLKNVGIEILNSHLDRQTVVVWIWCRSQAALQHIQKLYESNELRDVFVEAFQTPISVVISIDENQFKKPLVVCTFSICFTQRINIEEAMYYNPRPASRVTKLRNEICILFESSNRHPLPPPVIHVFEDQNPFDWQTEIQLTEIILPNDIESNKRENCLYVTDVYEKCVWKIKREEEEDGRHKIIKWLKTDHLPESMSVLTDGRFLIFSNSSSSLMMYGSDAELIRSIQLPTYIRNPHHAVETSIGNFIILHRWIREKGESGSNEGERVMDWGICELTTDGQLVMRRCNPSNETQQLDDPDCLSIDSGDRVFVVDTGNGRAIFLDFDLKWNRILIPTGENEDMGIPWADILCYDEEKKQLIVVGNQVYVYSICWK